MQQTTITCDRCGESWIKGSNTARQLWRVGIQLGCLAPVSTCSGPTCRNDLTAEWCRECVVKAGLIGQTWPTGKQVTPDDPAPTLDDLIREIVRDEAGA